MKNLRLGKQRNAISEDGFTLVEVMAVIIIIAVLAAIAIPKLGTSSEIARQKADIATGHELKTALDRYQVEDGLYPTSENITIDENTDGTLSASVLVPAYISKLDQSVTQQRASNLKKGFGIAKYSERNDQTTVTNLIMLYLTTDGSEAEVRTYNDKKEVLWTSAD